jgi:23S rRNA (uracil1939-C5)-methyltransferase
MELRCTGVAAGGDAIARAADGRVVFVRGGLPGELVRVHITRQAKDFVRAAAVDILEAADGRRTPSCPHVADGCGGCGWQHVAPALQTELKRAIVVEALTRIGKVAGVEAIVTSADPLPVGGHRTTVRARCDRGRVGFRAEQSHDPVFVRSCEVSDPVLEHLLLHSEFGDAREITLRRGAVTGEVMIIVDPSAEGVVVAKHRAIGQIQVVGAEVLAGSDQPYFHEIVSRHTFRISAGSFFQTRTDGAELLVRLVGDAIRSIPGRHDLLADLYGGVGLFAATVGKDFAERVSVEREGCSSLDARANLASVGATALTSDVDDFDLRDYAHGRPTVVVADPARGGLGVAGVARITEAAPLGVVLVSCDAASLGRDAGLLSAAGYQLRTSTVVDMFPDTPHVEVVSVFDPPL